jgi:hypothetical protein
VARVVLERRRSRERVRKYVVRRDEKLGKGLGERPPLNRVATAQLRARM